MKITRRTFLQSSAVAGLAAASSSMPTWAINTEGVKPAPHMPKPQMIKTNGITMAVYEQGEGTPIVFCHGFPELAVSWRHQMKGLSAAGYRCIAPDQRGYGLTGGPEDNSKYDMQYLCDDLIGMMDALKIDKAIFCGHDWGGGVVWAMPKLYPDRCLGIIALNTPTGRPSDLPPVERSEPSLIVMGPNYYVNTFMKPGRAEAILEKDIRHTIKYLLSKGGIWNKEDYAKMPEDSPERQLDLLAMVAKGELQGEQVLPDDVLDYFVDTYSITGFTGGLNWYRNAMKMGMLFKDQPTTVDVPSLYIGAEHDVVLPPASADGMEDFIADLEKYTVNDCGHWTQQEKPEEVNRVIIAWLNKKFPKK